MRRDNKGSKKRNSIGYIFFGRSEAPRNGAGKPCHSNLLGTPKLTQEKSNPPHDRKLFGRESSKNEKKSKGKGLPNSGNRPENEKKETPE